MRIIGIDLGTTNSCAAVFEKGEARVVENAAGERTIPSVISFNYAGDSSTGSEAKKRRALKPQDTIYSVKRYMGKSFEEIKNEKDVLPYELCCGKDGEVNVIVHGRKMTISEVSSHVLAKIKAYCEKALGESISDAVITVPAYFSDIQREATREAARLAGLKVRRILSEPTAAALAYGFGKDEEKTIAVYDLGGGTFDISILKIGKEGFEVLSTSGDTMLGGDDIDRRIRDYIVSSAKRQTGVDLAAEYANPITKMAASYTMQLVRDLAEKAKIALSFQDNYEINIPDYFDGKAVSVVMTRKNLDNMMSFVVDKTFKCCDQAISDAGNVRIDAVVLVGGSTKSPYIRQAVENYFHIKPDTSVNPDEAVALGAAVQAHLIESQCSLVLRDVTPLDLGVYGYNRNGEKSIITIIKRNTRIPAAAKMNFTAARAGQKDVDILIMQDKKKLGNMRLELEHLPSACSDDARKVKIEVLFSVDENGILTVRASQGGKSIKTTIRKSVA